MYMAETAAKHDRGNTAMANAEQLICNFIGVSVRAGYHQGGPGQ